jgi:iron complex transport system substrate-binding protein
MAARAETPATGGPRTFEDEMGRKVTLRTWPARRVVSLAPSITEILFAIGAGDTLVGRDGYSNFPREVEAVPVVGTDLEPSLERVLGLRPDVVITATTANRIETVEELERVGLAAFTTHTESLGELDATIRSVGALVDRAAEAEALAARLRAGLDEVRRAAAGKPGVPTLVVVWNDPLYVVGKDTYAAELLALAGGRNVADDAGAGFPRYALERVLRNAPEVLIIGSHSTTGGPSDPAAYWSRWPTIPAVKSGRIHLVDGDVVFRPGPRVVEAARALRELLAPVPPAAKGAP